MRAVLVCSGTINDYSIIGRYAEECDILIGVDGGTSHIIAAGYVPDIIFGDLDSIKPEDLHFVKQRNIETRKFNVEKDFTDSSVAIAFAVKENYKDIVILGGIGDRTDHMVANILSLRSVAEAGFSCSMINESNEITAVSKWFRRNLSDMPFMTKTVSLIALTEKVTGISTKGLKYKLINAALSMSNPSHGVSNEITEDSFEIEISGEGVLLVIMSKA